ncbi:MAG: apolipoprotein N-acyltransferase [Candidatus Goldbacteria bacterium]|nr:apolipoprotein N-acyltransferase [Candidatus Goldiibacteriota bacterium]
MKIHFILLALLSSLILAFSFPNIIYQGLFVPSFFLIWCAFIPVFYVIFKEDNTKHAFWFSYFSGFVFYAIGLYWLKNVYPMGAFAYVSWFALSAYLPLWIAVPAALSVILKKRFGTQVLLSLPALLTFGEYIREWLFSGFPLLTPAQSQFMFPESLQILKITGVHGLNYIIYFVNTAAALLLLKQLNIKEKQNITALAVFSSVFICAVISPFLFKDIKSTGKPYNAVILQANIDQDVNWDVNYRIKVLGTMQQMVKEAEKCEPDIFVWPETGFPGMFAADALASAEITGWTQKPAVHLIGSDYSVYKDGEMKYYNSIFALSGDAKITGSYSKFHLVPFGEYVPFASTFKFVKKVVRRYGYIGFEKGEKIEPVPAGAYKTAPLVCYDGLFPEISRRFAYKGVDFFAHLSYETWYARSAASAQIFTNTLLRAVENDRYLVRCVASGISGIVSNRGDIVISSGLFEKAMLCGRIYIDENQKKTPYTKYGDWFPFLMLILLGFAAFLQRKK